MEPVPPEDDAPSTAESPVAIAPTEAEAAAAGLEHDVSAALPSTSFFKHAVALVPLKPDDLAALVASDGDGSDPPATCAAAVSRLQAQPYDAEAWAVLIEESKKAQWQRRRVLACATSQFPTSGKLWAERVGAELSAPAATPEAAEEREERADALWAQGSTLCARASLELWAVHMERGLEVYGAQAAERDAAAREQRQAPTGAVQRASAARDALVARFDACLAQVGHDLNAGHLWQRYVDFVRTWPSSNAAERSERVAKLRAILQLASSLPLRDGLDLWNQYDRLEKHEVSGNEQLGAQLVEKHRPDARAAQEVAKARSVAWEGAGLFGPPGSPASLQALQDRLTKLPVPPCSSLSTEPIRNAGGEGASSSALSATTTQQGGWAPLLDQSVLGLEDAASSSAAAKGATSRQWQRMGEDQVKHLKAWQCRLAHERSNKERLPPAVARRRVVHSYEQMVSHQEVSQALTWIYSCARACNIKR